MVHGVWTMNEYRNWYLASFPWASPQHLLLAVLQATNAGVRPGNEATVEPPIVNPPR